MGFQKHRGVILICNSQGCLKQSKNTVKSRFAGITRHSTNLLVLELSNEK